VVFFNRKWFFDKVYNESVALPALNLGYSGTTLALDRGVIELFGPTGLSSLVSRRAVLLTSSHTGLLYHRGVLRALGVAFSLRLILSFQLLSSVMTLLSVLSLCSLWFFALSLLCLHVISLDFV